MFEILNVSLTNDVISFEQPGPEDTLRYECLRYQELTVFSKNVDYSLFIMLILCTSTISWCNTILLYLLYSNVFTCHRKLILLVCIVTKQKDSRKFTQKTMFMLMLMLSI